MSTIFYTIYFIFTIIYAIIHKNELYNLVLKEINVEDNVIDESNNTPDIIDNEFCVLSTHIEPGRGCGKMVHELTIYRTGGMRSSISEGK